MVKRYSNKMENVPDIYRPFSLRLSRVLDDIGLSSRLVRRRRKYFLQIEREWTVLYRILGKNVTSYCFGSQSEGTTTPGLNSDIDILHCMNATNIMSSWPEWEVGRVNLLMVKENTCSPQHYQLQEIRVNSPEPVIFPVNKSSVIGRYGRILLSNTHVGDIFKQYSANYDMPYLTSGPSHSTNSMLDLVFGYRCRTLPQECLPWFDRPRPGHWPTQEMFNDALQCGCFLVPDGHYDSVDNYVEWRISPNLIERLLMFSMKKPMIHCYVVLKMLKKFVVNRALGKQGKLTSFHCKTALFFAVENLPPGMWKDERLVECIMYCLNLFKRWSITGNCPHYIVSGVNLFDGKFTRTEQYKLSSIISQIMKSDLSVLLYVSADDVELRLFFPTTAAAVVLPNREKCTSRIISRLDVILHWNFLVKIRDILIMQEDSSAREMYEYLRQLVTKFNALHSQDISDIHKTRTQRALCGVLASVISSTCIKSGNAIGQICWSLYEISLPIDSISNRLKLASMLYCRGDLERAAYVLTDAERRYDGRVQAVCGCSKMNPMTSELRELNNEGIINDDDTDDLCIQTVSGCVTFLRQEAYCVPPILLFEMERGTGDDISHREPLARHWMKWAVVDALPFLYYLQFLTFRGIGQRGRQLQAFCNLHYCFMDGSLCPKLYHQETVGSLVGHCYEMEGDIEIALGVYRSLVEDVPRNNAAHWHIWRLANGITI